MSHTHSHSRTHTHTHAPLLRARHNRRTSTGPTGSSDGDAHESSSYGGSDSSSHGGTPDEPSACSSATHQPSYLDGPDLRLDQDHDLVIQIGDDLLGERMSDEEFLAEMADLGASSDEPVEAAGGGDRASSFEEAHTSADTGLDAADAAGTTDTPAGASADVDDTGGSETAASAAKGSSPTPLPTGWTQLRDAKTGRLYYAGPTGKTQWDIPTKGKRLFENDTACRMHCGPGYGRRGCATAATSSSAPTVVLLARWHYTDFDGNDSPVHLPVEVRFPGRGDLHERVLDTRVRLLHPTGRTIDRHKDASNKRGSLPGALARMDEDDVTWANDGGDLVGTIRGVKVLELVKTIGKGDRPVLGNDSKDPFHLRVEVTVLSPALSSPSSSSSSSSSSASAVASAAPRQQQLVATSTIGFGILSRPGNVRNTTPTCAHMPSHTVEAFLRRFYGQHIAQCVQEALREDTKMPKRRAGKRVGSRAIAYAFLHDLPRDLPLASYGDVALQRAFVDWGERSVIGKAPNEGTRYSVGRAQPLHELGSKSELKNPFSPRVNPGQLFFEVPKNGNNEYCGLLVMVNPADKGAYNAAFNPAKVAARSARSARAGGVGGVGAVGGGGGGSGGTGGDQRHYVHLQHCVGGSGGGEGRGGGQFEGLLPGSSSSSPSSSPSSSSDSTPRKRQRGDESEADDEDDCGIPQPVRQKTGGVDSGTDKSTGEFSAVLMDV